MSQPEAEPSTDDSLPVGEPFRLLFVCTGNTCRSPLCEVIARRALEERGWSGVEVRSAGVSAYPGAGASDGALRTAERHGLDLSGHRARPVTDELVEWADLILAMSPGHLHGVAGAGGEDHATAITAFAEGRTANPSTDAVPDPFGGTDPEYEATYRELVRLVERVLDRLAPVVAP